MYFCNQKTGTHEHMKKLFTIVAIALGMASCSQDMETPDAQNQEIKLTTTVQHQTRGTSLTEQLTEIAPGQTVGVTIANATAEHINRAWTALTDGSLNNNGNPVYYGSKAVTIYAYQPFDSSWTELDADHSFSVKADQSDDSDKGYFNSDLLWGTVSSTTTSSAVNIPFSHKLSKINVTLTSDQDLTGAVISILNTLPSTTINTSTGALGTASGNVKSIKAGVATAQNYTASAIIVPQTIRSGTAFIHVVLNGREFVYKLSNPHTFTSGYLYNFTLNISEHDITLDGEHVNEWETGNSEEGNMEPSFELNGHQFVDLGIVVDGQKILWATTNLGAENPWEFGKYYAWGETKAYAEEDTSNWHNYAYTGNSTYVKTYYDWSTYKWAAGTDESSITKYNSIDGQTKLEPEDDAATANWGDGWSMPTSFHFDALLQNCYWKVATMSVNGIEVLGYKIYKAKTDVDKGYIGDYSSETYSDADAHIFLPAAGNYFNENLVNPNKLGLYWMSEIDETAVARCLIFDPNHAVMPIGMKSPDIPSAARNQGASVRPVHIVQK